MTKEPIMIDDVNVAECEYAEPSYTTPKCAINDWIHCDGHDCHYKQLKRKEQECEEWAEKYKRLDNEYEGFAVKYTDMEIALKRKDEECEEWKSKYYNSTTEVKADLIKQLDQLKAELKEFKDMAKQGLDNYKDVGGCWGCGISLAFDELLESYKKLETKNAILTSNRMNIFERLDIVQKNDIYKQALQEIKEISKQINKEGIYGYVITDELDKILQKCEVLND